MAIVQYYVDAESVNMETELCEITDDEKYILDNGHHDKDLLDNLEWCASDCAEDYYYHHDGWESSWPVCLIIWIDGACKGKFSVEREFDPVFSANKVE